MESIDRSCGDQAVSLGSRNQGVLQISGTATDEDLQFAQQLGVNYVNIPHRWRHRDAGELIKLKQRVEAAGLKVWNIGNSNVHNMPEVTLTARSAIIGVANVPDLESGGLDALLQLIKFSSVAVSPPVGMLNVINPELLGELEVFVSGGPGDLEGHLDSGNQGDSFGPPHERSMDSITPPLPKRPPPGGGTRAAAFPKTIRTEFERGRRTGGSVHTHGLQDM